MQAAFVYLWRTKRQSRGDKLVAAGSGCQNLRKHCPRFRKSYLFHAQPRYLAYILSISLGAHYAKLFTMMNNTGTILQRLKLLNLDSDEALLYLELLKGPTTHLKLARATGINRSKVYRIVESLEKRSLAGIRSDDRGTFIIASDPATLEVELVSQENQIKAQRAAFQSLLPMLQKVKNKDSSSFIVHTYEGEEGFKQMLWHELKTKGENLIFGCGSLNDLVSSKRWLEQQRKRTQEAGHVIRELINPGEDDKTFSIEHVTTEKYSYRIVSSDTLLLANQIATYNDTVSIYHWRNQQKIGMEIISADYAWMMRQIFERYWNDASTSAP
jgi:sugar-specific transcriptional regulator TrmB